MKKTVEVSDNLKNAGLLLISFFGGIITSTLIDIFTHIARTLTLAVSLIFVILGIILVLAYKIRVYRWKKRLGDDISGKKA